MSRYLYIIALILLFLKPGLNGQEPGFIIERAPFCSVLNDEFAPVFYGEGLVFCSNRRDNSLIGYRDDRNRLYKIFYSPRNGSSKRIRLLSKDLTTYLNDGPVTFNKEMNVIYYSRNNNAGNYLGNISDTTNKLGIYRAELVNGTWTGIKPFEYNDPAFSVCMPSLDPDGTRLYFSSDMPGGYGGLDLYYCKRLNDGWDKPVNLGPVINTSKNESFPFAYYYNKLYYSSDGYQNSQGKDIYYTQEMNDGLWIAPVRLDSAFNSSADDFGIVFDSTLEKGFFSSNRLKSDDIFSFRTPPVEFTSCENISESNYCYLFYDERLHPGDTVRGEYTWDFGGGVIRTGTQVLHCFPGPGDYSVKLNILDTQSGDTLSEQVSYDINIEAIELAYINSYSSGIVDVPVRFDGLDMNLKDLRLTDYYWNFGDGFLPGGPVMQKTFRKNGSYTVQMGLLGEKDNLGNIQKRCFTKKIRIFDSFEEYESTDTGVNEFIALNEDFRPGSFNVLPKIIFMNDLSARQKNRIKSSLRFTGQNTLKILRNGMLPDSPLLDNLIEIIKQNPEIMLEMVLHSFEEESPAPKLEMSERWAQEIAVYFENRDVGNDSFSCRGLGASGSLSGPVDRNNKSISGVIELIFMNKTSNER